MGDQGCDKGLPFSAGPFWALGHYLGQCRDWVWSRLGGLVLRHGIGVATGGPSLLYCDRKFSVVTENLRKSVVTENFVSRQGLGSWGQPGKW